MNDYIRVVCITANVESFGQDPSLVKPWVKAVATEISEQKPTFAVVHVQGLPPPQEPRSRAEDVFSAGQLYTFRASPNFAQGLGSVYLVQDPRTVVLWNASNNSFASVQPGHEFLDKIGRNPNIQRAQFPDKLNPNVKAGSGGLGFGSKNAAPTETQPVGFLTTKWKIFSRPFAFTNLQLYSNSTVGFRDIRQTLSDGALVRQDQIQFLLQRVESNSEKEAHFFAGGFNTELDQDALVNDLAKHMSGATTEKMGENGTIKNLLYFDFKGQPLITLGEKRFDFHGSHNWYFGFSRGQMVKKYNREISKQTFDGILNEPPIYFAPSSHYSFDRREDKDSFLRHRCPQWSDRIFVNQQAWEMMKYDSFSSSGQYYGIVGTDQFLGSHKPVAMHATICVKPPKPVRGTGEASGGLRMTSV